MEIRTTRAVARLAGGLAVAVIGVVWAMPPGANAQVDLQPSARVVRDRDFGLALFRVAAKEHPKDNFVMSTYSVAEAFSLLSAGANGRTLAQLNKALAGTGHVDHGLRKALRDALLAPAPAGLDSAQIAVANSLWVVPLYPLTESFTRTAMDDYGAAARSLERDPQESAKAINDWISEVTKGEITAPVSPEALGPLTRAVLVNAVYFHGRWVFAFSKELTRPAPFRGRGGGALPADFMHGEAKVRLRGAGRVAVIPYMGGWQMEVELPAKATAAGIGAAMADLHRDDKGTVCEDTPIALPKWKTTSQLELIDTMKRLGVRAVFDSARADLTGVSPRAAGEGLFVSSAVHNAVMQVDEEGTKAAASTVIVSQNVSAPSRAPECPALLSFDRPFAYVIRHSQTGEILFSGTVLNPSPPARLP